MVMPDEYPKRSFFHGIHVRLENFLAYAGESQVRGRGRGESHVARASTSEEPPRNREAEGRALGNIGRQV